jgi:hypothetical protein
MRKSRNSSPRKLPPQKEEAMLVKATLAAAISILCSPAIGDELRTYTVTVMEQIRHEITVEAAQEYAARTDALLEARRISGSGKPWWERSPPSVLARARQADGFAVIAIEPVPIRPGHYPGQPRLEVVAAP